MTRFIGPKIIEAVVRIVGAIDIKAGKVVRAVAGERNAYRPIDSRLCETVDPAAIATALWQQLGLQQIYLADLDALAGEEPAWEVYGTLLQSGVSLWIDAGLSDLARVERMVDFAEDHPSVNGIVGALETLPDQDTLQRSLEMVGPERFIFGLDLKDGRPLTEAADWGEMIAPEIAAAAVAAGVQQLIAVDLASVGMHGGCATDRLVRLLHHRFPDLHIYAGGGIRGLDDLHALARHGCAAAMASSALHDGWLSAEDLQEFIDE